MERDFSCLLSTTGYQRDFPRLLFRPFSRPFLALFRKHTGLETTSRFFICPFLFSEFQCIYFIWKISFDMSIAQGLEWHFVEMTISNFRLVNYKLGISHVLQFALVSLSPVGFFLNEWHKWDRMIGMPIAKGCSSGNKKEFWHDDSLLRHESLIRSSLIALQQSAYPLLSTALCASKKENKLDVMMVRNKPF